MMLHLLSVFNCCRGGVTTAVGVVLQLLLGWCYNCCLVDVTSAVGLVLQLLLIGVTKYCWVGVTTVLLLIGVTKYCWGGVTTAVWFMLQLLLGLCYICCWSGVTTAVDWSYKLLLVDVTSAVGVVLHLLMVVPSIWFLWPCSADSPQQ